MPKIIKTEPGLMIAKIKWCSFLDLRGILYNVMYDKSKLQIAFFCFRYHVSFFLLSMKCTFKCINQAMPVKKLMMSI